MITSMNRLNVHDRAMFLDALKQIFRADYKRSRSARLQTHAEKMTLKDIYRDRKMCASHDNNLPRAIKDDIDQFVASLRREGYIMKRLPSVNINPKDLQKIRRKRREKKLALNKLGDFFDYQKLRYKPIKPIQHANPCKNLQDLRKVNYSFSHAKNLIQSKQRVNESL